MRIVIVEDNNILSLALSKMLEKMNHDVIALFTKGRQAYEKIPHLNPDLIIMDILLEDEIDGIEVMQLLRQDSVSIPVIYVTGNSDKFYSERAKKTQYVDYLVKPVIFDQLQNSLKKVK